jgi:hypothetical protein
VNAENLSGYSNNATQSNQFRGSSASGLFTKETLRHQDSSSLECVIYSNNNQYPASWYGFAGCF